MNLQPISSTLLSAMFQITPQRILEITESESYNLDPSEYTKGTKPRFYSPNGVRKILNKRGLNLSEKRIICFANNKGGVGKTSCAVNTASMYASMGFKTLLIDGDLQANLTNFLLDTPSEHNLNNLS